MSNPPISDLTSGSLELPKNEIEQNLEGIEFEPLNNYFESIIQNAQVKFRDNIEAEAPKEAPGLVYGDSESDEEPSTPQEWRASTLVSSSARPVSLNETIIGGAVVKNLALVIPDGTARRFGDLPVLPIIAVGQDKTELVTVISKDTEEGGVANIPFLIMPDEEGHKKEPTSNDVRDNISRLAASSVLSDVGKISGKKTAKAPVKKKVKEASDGTTTGKKGEKDREDRVAKTQLENYVLSGDIENFFGIKGLTAKLYKFKGPETKEDKGETHEKKEGTDDKEDKSTTGDEEKAEPGAQAEGKDIVQAKADKTDSTAKKGKTDKSVGKGKDGDKSKQDEEEKEPVREKVKINPKSLALMGKPLGTLLPFLESEEIQSLPIENLEFTYCEEKSGHFFPPGLRLEVDVMLKDSLQWATDALQKMFGDKRTPKKIHLSAELGKKRDWSKRPKVDDFALRGYFTEFGYQSWDILQFKTLGLELTATKAARNPSRADKLGKEGDDGKDKPKQKDDNDGTETQPSLDATEEDRTGSQSEISIEGVSALQVEPDPTESQPKQGADGKDEEDGSSTKAEDKESPSKDDKEKVKKSYNYGFGFFGTVSFIKIPHANAPLDLHIRIARDFEVEEKKDKGKDGKDEKEVQVKKKKKSSSDSNQESENTTQDDQEMIPAASAEEAGAESAVDEPSKGELKPKEHSDGRHKRIWKVVIYCDEWKNIYGVKNVTLKKAELKWSFEQRNFKKTMAFDFSADAKLGAGKVKVKGKFSKNENFIDGEVGDLSLTDIKKIHAQIQGHEVPEEKKIDETEKTAKETEKEKEKKEEEKKDEKEEAKGNEITFKKLHVKLSSKFIKKQKTTKRSLTLEGDVTFNGQASAQALLEINNDGLTISGGLSDYKIPETLVTIEEARIHIFIGFKHKKKIDKNEEDDNTAITDAPSAGKESGQPDKTETETVIKSPKKVDKGDQDKAASKPDGKVKKTKRESEFAILGVVKINEVEVSVGFYTARTKEKAKRDWLAFGSIENLTLSKLIPGIKNEDFNLSLDNIALIASSDYREIKEDEEEDEENQEEGSKSKKANDNKLDQKSKGEKKTAGKKDKGENIKDDEESAHAGVLKRVERYKYPISKGVQLCATIRKFEPVEQLNKNKPIDGLVMIIAFTPEGLLVKINLPKSLQVPLHPHAILGDFGGTLYAAEGALELSTALTILSDEQKPIRIIGKIRGSLVGARGELHMHQNDKWTNPFGLNKKVALSQLGFGAEINYATVWVQGPDALSFSGQIHIGREYSAAMAFSIGLKKEQLILVRISEFNLSKLARLAGEMTDIVALQNLSGGDDALVFRKMKLYMSTGGVILGIHYDKGIQVTGEMEFFGKKGEFDGQINDDGVMIKGGIDNFNIGGLEIRSTKAKGKRATMDIEMTEETQRIFIDGMIRFYDFELSIFIDANLQEKRLDADISVKFTENILLHLKAKTTVSDSEFLDGVVMDFEADIRPDVIGAIFDAIDKAIDTIGKTASKTIEQAEQHLQRQVEEKDLELEEMGNKLQDLRDQVDQEVQDRRERINKDNQERHRLEQELDQLNNAVNKALEEMNQNNSELNKLKKKQDKTAREFDQKIRDKNTEYEGKIEEERNKQRKWEDERRKLEDQKEASFGDVLRSKQKADESWQWWEDQENEQSAWVKKCWANADWAWAHLDFAGAISWTAQAKYAEGKLDTISARKAIDAELRRAGEAVFSTDEWRLIEVKLNEATDEIEKHANALDLLLKGEEYEALQALQRDKKQELGRQIAAIGQLEDMSRNIERKLHRARRELNDNKGRITDKEKKLQDEVAILKGELEKKPFEDEYKAKCQMHESVKAQIQIIQDRLQAIRKGTDEATKLARACLDQLKQGLPTVERILVIGSTDIFANDKPLIFKIDARWKGKPVHTEAQWAPGWSVTKLYDDIASKVITATGEQA